MNIDAKRYAEAYFDECVALRRELKQQRAAIVEECARVVETAVLPPMVLESIAAALRALKDKPQDKD